MTYERIGTFPIPGGGGGGSGGNYIMLPVFGAVGDGTNPPYLDFTAANRPFLVFPFNASIDYLCTWSFRMPDNYSSTLLTLVQYSMSSTDGSKVVQFRQEIMAIADTENVTTDNYATVTNSAAIPSLATATELDEATITAAATIAAGDYVAFRLGRENTPTSGTNHTGDIRVWAVALTYTAA